MLSKLEFFASGARHPSRDEEQAALVGAVQRHFRGHISNVQAVVGGTLGVCVLAEIDGSRRFLKSHLPHPAAEARLAKEAEILVQLYGGAVLSDRLRFTMLDGSARLCLVLAELAPLDAPLHGQAAARLARANADLLVHGMPRPLRAELASFADYLRWAEQATADLERPGLISARSAGELRRLTGQLAAALPSLPRTVCHGDFGPRNVMTDGSRDIVIDWEDALWGVAGYDYLYWLTFLENRDLMLSHRWESSGLAEGEERAILALIVLLKSFLSVLSGAYRTHTLSIDERISEVLDL